MGSDRDDRKPKTLWDADSTNIPEGETLEVVWEPGSRPGEPWTTVSGVVLGKALGRGAMGEVWQARDPTLEREVAIKRIDPRRKDIPRLRRRFETEARVMAQLDHPGVVPIYALHDDGSQLEYTMRLVRGKDLQQWLVEVDRKVRAGQPLRENEVMAARLEVFVQLCDTVAYAHSRGVLHRDLKPANVMLGPYHEVLLMDWGIAKLIGAPDDGEGDGVEVDSSVQTLVGDVLGTPAFMSPEQAEGSPDIGPASDQYSLGLILYELVSLRRARHTESARTTLALARGGIQEALPARHPRALRAIIKRATATHPARRYPSVAELGDDVRRFLRDEPTHALPDNVIDRVQRWLSHHRSATLAAIVFLGLAAVAILLGAVVVGQHVHEAQQAAAREREQALSDHLAAIDRQARRIDRRLQGFEALLTGLAYAAEHTLREDAAPREVWLDQGEGWGPQGPPEGVVQSDFYKEEVSVFAPDWAIAPDVDLSAQGRRINQLAALHPALLGAQLDSYDPAARSLPKVRQRELITTGQTPIVWTYVALTEGLMVGQPGTSDAYADGYDPRTRLWYTTTLGTRGVRWHALDADESGMGLLLTATMGLWDESEAIGVAGIDLTFGYVIEQLIEPDDPPPGEAFLVDEEGRVVVRASQKERARSVVTYAPVPFPWPDAWGAIHSSGAHMGHHEEPERFFTYARLDAVPWTYIWVTPGGVGAQQVP